MEPIHSRVDPAIQGNVRRPYLLAALVVTGKDAPTGNDVLTGGRRQQQAEGRQKKESPHHLLPPAGPFISAAWLTASTSLLSVRESTILHPVSYFLEGATKVRSRRSDSDTLNIVFADPPSMSDV
jgi:hypothetical protein